MKWLSIFDDSGAGLQETRSSRSRARSEPSFVVKTKFIVKTKVNFKIFETDRKVRCGFMFNGATYAV